jgi:DNA-binding transcriptional regulator YhcF (GntR family)
MLLTLDLQSEVPIYQQIRQQVIQGVASGKLAPGESLPSVRQLAADIGVNLHTVNKSYQLLRDDGIVVIHRQRGVLIADTPKPSDPDAFLKTLSERLKHLAAEAVALGVPFEDFVALCSDAYLLHTETRITTH